MLKLLEDGAWSKLGAASLSIFNCFNSLLSFPAKNFSRLIGHKTAGSWRVVGGLLAGRILGKGSMAGEEQEYISEWPPLHSPIKEELPSPKKPKISENEVTGSDGPESFRELVECSPAVQAEPLLAKWWKKRTKHDGRSLFPPNTNSKNPKTILYHLSRYLYFVAMNF